MVIQGLVLGWLVPVWCVCVGWRTCPNVNDPKNDPAVDAVVHLTSRDRF